MSDAGDRDQRGGGRDDGAVPGETYQRTTDGVTITVQPIFLESQSIPTMRHYVWAYRVRVDNERAAPVRLMRRHWLITDSAGGRQEVCGDGVVGEQPVILPGEGYEYTSGAPLQTPSGMMSGDYEMETETGERFQVEIPTFSLDSPYERRLKN